MPLHRPRFIALDSSQLGNWCSDRKANDPGRREALERFERTLEDRAVLVVITLHHLMEILAVSKPLAIERLDFLSSFPMVAWLKSYGASGLPGGMIDVFALEIEASLNVDTAHEVRAEVSKRIFEIAPGHRPVELLRNYLETFQSEFHAHAESQRQQIAITRAQAAQAPKVTLRELGAMRFKEPQALSATYSTMKSSLQSEIATRGDRRISRPAGDIAAAFFDRVSQSAPSAGIGIIDALRSHLARIHVDIDELGPDATFSDLMELGVFRQHLKVVAENLPTVPWQTIKARANEDKMPSALVEKGLRLYAQDQPERSGSEISDRYLATMACYADLTFVDKRTQSDIVHVKRKIPALSTLIRRTEKVTSWDRVVEHIEGLSESDDPV